MATDAEKPAGPRWHIDSFAQISRPNGQKKKKAQEKRASGAGEGIVDGGGGRGGGGDGRAESHILPTAGRYKRQPKQKMK